MKTLSFAINEEVMNNRGTMTRANSSMSVDDEDNIRFIIVDGYEEHSELTYKHVIKLRNRLSYNAMIRQKGTEEWSYIDNFIFPNEDSPKPPLKGKMPKQVRIRLK